ncbi:hypothetical protein ebA4593 [Aromatoleum aromaticum EbN1]|uniref:Uncharacterized protein n=1 Tax=Aromatoleum aromaticum (strain DSM 19018 / LMG 30748 / EbN1) TaxID=76114 RepID=Q5P1T9_AROAE|nr:hypothetical protein ebA4593 [Aromatoleum aromaticum EbN1]
MLPPIVRLFTLSVPAPQAQPPERRRQWTPRPSAPGCDSSADPLPQAGFFFEPIQFQALEVAARDDADDGAVSDDRQVAIAAVAHHAQRIDRGALARDGVRVGRHHRHKRGARIMAFRERSDHVPAGQNAGEPPFLHDERRTDATFPHCLAGAPKGIGGCERYRSVILHDQVKATIGHDFLRTVTNSFRFTSNVVDNGSEDSASAPYDDAGQPGRCIGSRPERRQGEPCENEPLHPRLLESVWIP